jgi:hypothetical protein
LIQAVHLMYFEEEGRDDALLGKRVAELTAKVLVQAQRDIKDAGAPLVNVTYTSLIDSPIDTVKTIYAQLGWEVSMEHQQAMEQYIVASNIARSQQAAVAASSNTQGALHTYSEKDFGLTITELREEKSFAAYLKERC